MMLQVSGYTALSLRQMKSIKSRSNGINFTLEQKMFFCLQRTVLVCTTPD